MHMLKHLPYTTPRRNRRIATTRNTTSPPENTCPICAASFAKKPEFTKHMETQHNIITDIKCAHCDVILPRKSMTTHISRWHPQIEAN